MSEKNKSIESLIKFLDQVETKINKPVFSSNQTLIWDTIRSAGYKNSISGYGKL